MKITIYLITLFISIISLQSCKTADQNVLIFDNQKYYKPCEPSIAINPKNPNHIVAGSILDNVHVSTNGGKSWKSHRLTSSYGVYGDPVICADYDGSFYYCHLADPEKRGWASSRLLESIIVQRSDDTGASWTDGAAVGANPPKDQDKEWICADPYNGNLYMTWTEFDKYNSENPNDHTRILFSASMDKGDTWTKPKSLSFFLGNCLDENDTVEGATPAAGKDGKVFVAWAGHENIYFNRSTDQGKTWMKKETIIANQKGGWNLPIKGMKRVNAMPVLHVDHSGGPHDGRIYVMWGDQRDGETNTNIYLQYSDDDGETWSSDRRIHSDENNAHQYFPWFTIDQSSGFLYAVFYDRKNYDNFLQNDVTLSWSYDGGETWSNRIISERPFQTPPEFIFFGDYNNISAVDGNIRPIWTRYDEGNLSIWTALISERNKNKQVSKP